LLPTINMLWVGPELGYIERLSIASFLAHGHPVHLHTYVEVANVPSGANIMDAAEVLPWPSAERLRHRRTSSFALASDLFRFRLQQLGRGIWADCDVVCLRPVVLRGPILAGWESDDYINGGVLFLAPDEPLLADAVASFRDDAIPDWVPFWQSLPFYLRRAVGSTFGPADLPRGSFGPKALTALFHRHGRTSEVLPAEFLYPLHPRRAREVFEPGTSLDSYVTENSLTLHLWNEKLRDLKSARPDPTSALGRLLTEYGL
jgi:hypothetical protein